MCINLLSDLSSYLQDSSSPFKSFFQTLGALSRCINGLFMIWFGPGAWLTLPALVQSMNRSVQGRFGPFMFLVCPGSCPAFSCSKSDPIHVPTVHELELTRCMPSCPKNRPDFVQNKSWFGSHLGWTKSLLSPSLMDLKPNRSFEQTKHLLSPSTMDLKPNRSFLQNNFSNYFMCLNS